MFTISKSVEFDAGHRVPLHRSKCKNPHGHRYKVVAYLKGELIESGPETGMVKDFGNVKQVMMDLVHDVYDHAFIVHQADLQMLEALGIIYGLEGEERQNDWKIVVVPFVPTAENLARSIYYDLKSILHNLRMIEVYETPTSVVTYSEE